MVDYSKSYLLPLQNIKLDFWKMQVIKLYSTFSCSFFKSSCLMRQDFHMLAQYKWDVFLLYFLNFRNLFYLVGHWVFWSVSQWFTEHTLIKIVVTLWEQQKVQYILPITEQGGHWLCVGLYLLVQLDMEVVYLLMFSSREGWGGEIQRIRHTKYQFPWKFDRKQPLGWDLWYVRGKL